MLGNKNSLCIKVQSVGVALVFFFKDDGCYFQLSPITMMHGAITGTDLGGRGGVFVEHPGGGPRSPVL